MTIHNGIADTIGNTPIIRLNTVTEGLRATVLAKLEFFNPCSSVKDRIAASMISAGEINGDINKRTLIVEATSGNTGIALAFICAAKGYRLCLTMPETMSDERKKLLRHLGAHLELTPGAEGMKGAIKRAREIGAEEKNSFLPDQFGNPANPEIHEKTTAVEIMNATAGNVDILVAGVGTGGTITGISRAIKAINPDFKSIAVEPESSAVLSGRSPGPHKIQGIGAGFIPKILDTALIDGIEIISNDEALETARDLAKYEGILCGISSGAAVSAALKIAQREENKGKTIITILPSTGERYLSTDLFKV